MALVVAVAAEPEPLDLTDLPHLSVEAELLDLAHPVVVVLPLVLLQVAAVLPVPLPQEPEVAAVVLVQGLVASESFRRR